MRKQSLGFQVHPVELERRRIRCKQLVRKIQAFEFETMLKCNICGNAQSILLSDVDRYGLSVRSAMCSSCGLVYLVDRLTADGYKKFYEDGIYREFISLYKGKRQTSQEILNGQVSYAKKIVSSLKGFLSQTSGEQLLLDIGGSTGLVSKEMEKAFGYKSLILEPAVKEAEVSRAQGQLVEVGSIESWVSDKKFDLILLCRTFEHILDLRLAFENIHKMLAPDGLFFCDIADFSVNCALYGPPQVVTQIDHCFWLSKKYAPQFFERVGFTVVRTFINLPDYQVGYLLKPFSGKPSELSMTGHIVQDVENYQEYQRLWHAKGQEYYDFFSWLRLKLYRLKKKYSL